MATRIQPSPTAETNNSGTVQPQHRPAPVGISAQQPTVTSESAGSSSSLGFFGTIGEFFRTTCVAILETINGWLGSLASFVRGGPKEELPSDAWMLPEDTPAPTQTPTPQPQSPTDTTPPTSVATTPTEPDPFSSLPIAADEKRKIFQIVHTLGTTSPIFLWPQQNTLEQLGREIEHVHPFKFLEYILLHTTLRTDLDTVRNSTLLWPRFLEGLANKLNRERQDLPANMPGFARSLQIPPTNLEPFLRSGNWEAMTFYLIDIKLGRTVLPPTPTVDPTPVVAPNTVETPPLTATATPVETPTAAPSAWSQIQLSEREKIMVADLVRSHRNMGYYGALRGDRYVDSLWDRLDQVHPLALLTHLFTTPELMTDINLLWPYRLHRHYFTSELSKILNRRPETDYLPHLADFTAAVRKDQVAITAEVHLRRWPELVEVLKAPSI